MKKRGVLGENARDDTCEGMFGRFRCRLAEFRACESFFKFLVPKQLFKRKSLDFQFGRNRLLLLPGKTEGKEGGANDQTEAFAEEISANCHLGTVCLL